MIPDLSFVNGLWLLAGVACVAIIVWDLINYERKDRK